jgi:hypothetical protein
MWTKQFSESDEKIVASQMGDLSRRESSKGMIQLICHLDSTVQEEKHPVLAMSRIIEVGDLILGAPVSLWLE